MRRYYFHLIDNDIRHQDNKGIVFETLTEVAKEAHGFLAEIAKQLLPEDGERRLAIEVLDEAGERIIMPTFQYDPGQIKKPSESQSSGSPG